jgi:hypothetical protein
MPALRAFWRQPTIRYGLELEQQRLDDVQRMSLILPTHQSNQTFPPFRVLHAKQQNHFQREANLSSSSHQATF